jgi:peptide/nickel transport system substrate-binding protein
MDDASCKLTALLVEDSPLIWVVHDSNPHALSPKIKRYVQAQHWFQDLSTLGVD